MRTAREAFFQSTAKTEFAKMAETATMDSALEYALLVYLEELPFESDPNSAWGAHCRVIGARDVLKILRSMHLPQERPTPYRPLQLKPPQ